MVGMMKFFEYHCYEGEDSSDAELWHHTHQKVDVLKELVDVDEEVGKMYRIRFSDGFGTDAFEDELVDNTSKFYMPDYSKARNSNVKEDTTH